MHCEGILVVFCKFWTVDCHGAEYPDRRKVNLFPVSGKIILFSVSRMINPFPDSRKIKSFPGSRYFGCTEQLPPSILTGGGAIIRMVQVQNGSKSRKT